VKRGESEQAEMGRLKTVHQTQHASSYPVRGIQDMPRAAGIWMTVKSRRLDQNPSKAKKQDYFKGVFFRIISLYCIVMLDFS